MTAQWIEEPPLSGTLRLLDQSDPKKREKMSNKVTAENLCFLLEWLECYDAEDEDRTKEIETLTKWLNKQIERKTK